MPTSKRPIVNIYEVEFTQTLSHDDKYAAKLAPLSSLVGAHKTSFNVTAVAPGKRAFPFHNHHVNEELFLILYGNGTLRFGEQEFAVRAGDLMCCPPGGPEVAHQLVNTGDEELRYLAVATCEPTDVFQYPDSGKFGFATRRPPSARIHEAAFSGFYKTDSAVDYYDGE